MALEVVLPLPDFGKHCLSIGQGLASMAYCRRLNAGLIAAQKGVGLQLFSEQRRHSGKALRAPGAVTINALPDSLCFGFHRSSKVQIGQRVFMGTIYAGVCRKPGQLLQ